MKHLITKEKNILNGTIGWSHKGRDSQYCEAGETVKIKWQPTAGWGLQEVHYTDAGGNVVAIEGGEFVMPDSDVVIGGTFNRFTVQDWTSGTDASENAGKVLGFDNDGQISPVSIPTPEEPTYTDQQGSVIVVGADGKATSLPVVQFRKATPDDNDVMKMDFDDAGKLNIGEATIKIEGPSFFSVNSQYGANKISIGYDGKKYFGSIEAGIINAGEINLASLDTNYNSRIIMKDSADPTKTYEITIVNGELTCTQV